MSAASFLNAYVAWLRDRYYRTEEGKHQWQTFWAGITAPPPGVVRRALAAVPTTAPEDPYAG